MNQYNYENGYRKKKERIIPTVALIAIIPVIFLVVVFVVVVFCIITLKFYPDGVMAQYIIAVIDAIQTKISGV